MKSWLIVIYRIFSRDFLFSIFIFFFATFDIYEYFLFFFIEKMCNIIRLVFDTFFPEIPYLCDETPPSRKRNNCDFFNWKKSYIFHPFSLYRFKGKKKFYWPSVVFWRTTTNENHLWINWNDWNNNQIDSFH